MKLNLFLIGAALLAWPVAAHEGCGHSHAEGEAHEHAEGETCSHHHEEGEEHDHAEHEHKHAEGETCSHHHEEGEEHDHAEHEHKHAEGETCSHHHEEGEEHDHAEHEHHHAEGETCSHHHEEGEEHDHAEHEHHHAEGETCSHHHEEGEEHDHAEHEHHHAEGETCSHHHEEGEEHDHHHAEGETCDRDHGDHTGHDHSHAPVVVKVDARSRHILNMQVEAVAQGRGMLTHSMYGTLTVPEHATETYALPCAGFITLQVKSAQPVKAGDVLYTLVSPELNDRALEREKAEAALTRAEAELAVLQERKQKLSGVGVVNSELESQLNFKQAELRQLAQERATASTRMQMMLRGGELVTDADGVRVLSVRSRGAGTVRNVGVTQGSWGEQGAPVIVMSHPESMEIRGELYSGSIPSFDAVRATMPVGRENKEVAGTWRLSEQADAEKQTRTLFFTPAALPAGARPGQLCRLDLYEQGKADTVTIPDSAVVRVGMDDMVFVEVGEGSYAAVIVHAGESRRGMTPVSGLPQGGKIVVKGGQELRQLLPTAAAAAKKPGHFHADGSFHEGEH